MKFTPNQPFYNSIGSGLAPGQTPWMKTGYNGDIDSAAAEDIIPQGGNQVWMSLAGQRLELVSTGAQDTAAGTGIQQVRLSYLDTSYVARTETITMAGAVAVPTVAANIIRINAIRAARVGGNYVAAGNIDVRTLGGGGSIYSRIMTGQTRGRNSTYTVPSGLVLYVTSIVFSCGSSAGGKTVLFTTRATYNDNPPALLGPNFFMPFHEIQLRDSATSYFYRQLEIPTRLPATVDIRVSAAADGNDVIATCVLRGYTATA
jgi:hypothetical protein